METKLKQEPVADGGGLPPTHEWLGAEEVNDWFIASCSCGWTYQHPNYGTTQDTFVNHWGDHILASSQEALRLAREEAKKLQNWLNLGGVPIVIQGVPLICEYDSKDVHQIHGSAFTSCTGMPICEIHTLRDAESELASATAKLQEVRERMQQAVDLLSNMNPTHQLWKVSKAISLLSPEGSSR